MNGKQAKNVLILKLWNITYFPYLSKTQRNDDDNVTRTDQPTNQCNPNHVTVNVQQGKESFQLVDMANFIYSSQLNWFDEKRIEERVNNAKL